MWADALRIVKEYIPSKLDEFQKEMAAKSGKYAEYYMWLLVFTSYTYTVYNHICCRNYEELLSQGSMWEQNGEYSHAIDLYLQLNTQNCSDLSLLIKTWEKVRYYGIR